MNYINRFNTALDYGLSKSVFDHLRNYLMCSLLLAIGIVEFKSKTGLFFGQVESNYSGIGIIGLSCILFCINLFDGIRKISKYKYHQLITVILIILYVIIVLRVIELALSFRII